MKTKTIIIAVVVLIAVIVAWRIYKIKKAEKETIV
jgi:predicted negative regulator of RcsB-dependent stress response